MKAPEELLTALAGLTVVVVDDEPDSLDVAATLLAAFGANVITASNGEQALAAVRQHHPAFVVSDLSMPVMSGWELLHAIQRDETTAAIPVIALTAHAMAGDRDRALAAGFHDYMTKPIRPETFVTDLLRVIRTNRSVSARLNS